MEKEPHPVCGHLEFPDRFSAAGPCAACLDALLNDHTGRKPHPFCGCLKPVAVHRHDGPCGWCRKDAARAAGVVADPRANDPPPSVEDFRRWRRPLLEATDWVETNPTRVAREPEQYVAAIRAFRRELLDGPATYAGGAMPQMPARPEERRS